MASHLCSLGSLMVGLPSAVVSLTRSPPGEQRQHMAWLHALGGSHVDGDHLVLPSHGDGVEP